jgi:glycosyltransferase involved in cell wall biosynthesis
MICPFPPPVTGESFLAERFERVLQAHGHQVKRLNLASEQLNSGGFRWRRLFQMLSLAWHAAISARLADRVYFFPAESALGNFRDFVLYSAMWMNLQKVVVHLHGGSGFAKILKAQPRRVLNRWFLKRTKCLIVEGAFAANIFSQYCPGIRINVVSNYAPSEYRRRDVLPRVAQCAVEGEFRVVFLGNMIEGKGWRDLVLGYFLLPLDIRRRTVVHFIGSYNNVDAGVEVSKFATESNGRLVFHGPLVGVEKEEILIHAHVLCLPTYYEFEGQPMAILEGYAAGCVIVATQHAGIPDVFQDGVNGIAVESRSPESIARALSALNERVDNLSAISERNLALARSEFSEEIVSNRITKILLD